MNDNVIDEYLYFISDKKNVLYYLNSKDGEEYNSFDKNHSIPLDYDQYDIKNLKRSLEKMLSMVKENEKYNLWVPINLNFSEEVESQILNKIYETLPVKLVGSRVENKMKYYLFETGQANA